MSVFAVGDGRPTRTEERTAYVACCDFCGALSLMHNPLSSGRGPVGWTTRWLTERVETCPRHGGIVPGAKTPDATLEIKIRDLGMAALGITEAERIAFRLDPL